MKDKKNDKDILVALANSTLNKLRNRDEHYTNLVLDPEEPGIGGQLGGTFEIQAKLLREMPVNEPVQITIANHLYNRVLLPDNQHSIIWHKSKRVDCTITPDRGITGTFLFDLPEKCKATGKTRIWREAKWNLTIQAEFAKNIYARGVIASWPIDVQDVPKTSNISPLPDDIGSNATNSSKTDPLDPFKEVRTNKGKETIVLSSVGLLFILVGVITGINLVFLPFGILIICFALFGKDAS